MPERKNVGQLDADLLARVDERATELGQSRVVFVTRALEGALAGDTEQGRLMREMMANAPALAFSATTAGEADIPPEPFYAGIAAGLDGHTPRKGRAMAGNNHRARCSCEVCISVYGKAGHP